MLRRSRRTDPSPPPTAPLPDGFSAHAAALVAARSATAVADHQADGATDPAASAGGGPGTPRPDDAVVARLERAMDELEVSDTVAFRVMEVVDSPVSTATSIAAVVELDPMFSAQVLRIANSAGFGSMSTVSTVARAVAMIGLPTIRGMAATAAVRGAARHAPPGFWEHSAATAGGCVAASAAFGLARDEAFSMGLLHDLGWAILDVVDPVAHERIRRAGLDGVAQCESEAAHFGMAHDEVAGRVLQRWNFPATLVAAIGRHHRPLSADPEHPSTTHARVLAVGDALAHRVLSDSGLGFDGVDLGGFGFSEEAADHLTSLTESFMEEILASLSA